MNQKQEYFLKDGQSHFRVEPDGRIRLVLRPEERVILVGQWREREGILYLFKSKSNFDKRSYTLAVPWELWLGIREKVKVIGLEMRDTRTYLATSKEKLLMFGYHDEYPEPNDRHQQIYYYLDMEHWDRVDGIGGVLSYGEDQKAFESMSRRSTMKEYR